jgi:hypothetical protein
MAREFGDALLIGFQPLHDGLGAFFVFCQDHE